MEFWGRYKIVSPDPNGGNEDVISFGDPAHGKFRIFPGDAPPPQTPSGFGSMDGKIYGQNSAGSLPTGASFVTSQWLSRFPKSPLPVDITHQVSPFPGRVADDYVIVADRARFNAAEPLQDWLQISDRYGPSSVDDRISGEQLLIRVRSPLDFIDGFALDQASSMTCRSRRARRPFGFFQAKVGDAAGAFHEFSVDHLSVTPHVCRP